VAKDQRLKRMILWFSYTKGIAARKFSTVFNLPEYVEVESALFSNGILELTL